MRFLVTLLLRAKFSFLGILRFPFRIFSEKTRCYSLRKASYLFLLILVFSLDFSAFAHEGETHESEAKEISAKRSLFLLASAERNVETENGSFKVILKRLPKDLRASEKAQFSIYITEKIEGGFGDKDEIPVDRAKISVFISKSEGAKSKAEVVAENLPVKSESEGIYRFSYTFSEAGDYKIAIQVTTEDNRQFSVDFPFTVLHAPSNSSFWLGLALLLFGSSVAFFYLFKLKNIVFSIGLVTCLFILGLLGLLYFFPLQKARTFTEIPVEEIKKTQLNSPENSITLLKEAQLLFGVRTELVTKRKIRIGLKVNGIIKAKPEGRGVVIAGLTGRVVLNEGIRLGAAVRRNQSIGTIEQLLDVSNQATIESQRLELEAQKRDVEIKQLELKNTILQLQSQLAQQKTRLNQAKAQFFQAQRELSRTENLLKVGAVSQRRLEEAQTNAKIAEQEVGAAEQEVAALEEQIKQVKAVNLEVPKIDRPKKFLSLTSPIKGLIEEIKVTNGQIVEAGKEILSIIDLSEVLLEAQIFENYLPILRKNGNLNFTDSEGNVYEISGEELVSIGQVVDPQTRTVSVIYRVKNPLLLLKDGMFVEVNIQTEESRLSLAIPKKAVLREQGQTFVFVFKGGEVFEKRMILLGAEDLEFAEVKSGLKEGERIVVEGLYQLKASQY